MSYLGAAAGGTLGFIFGNTRGAVRGAKLGYKLRPWTMAPWNKKRRASTTLTGPYLKKARFGPSAPRPTTSSATSRRSSTASVRSRRSGGKRTGWSTRSRRSRRTRKGRSYSARRQSGTKSLNYGAGTSYGSYGSGPRAYPGFYKRGQYHSFVSTDVARISSGNASQGWGVLPGAAFATLGTPANLTTSRYLPSLDLMNYIGQDLLRDTQTPGQAFADGVGTVSTPGYLTQKFVIPSISLKHELKNQTTTMVHVSLYDLVLRETSIPVPSPIGDISTGLLQERTGYASAQNGGSPESSLGVTPFQSSLFCKRWKVVKTTTLAIPAGSTHVHTFTNKPKKMFSFDDDTGLSQATNTGMSGQGALKPFQGYTTTCTIARVWGSIADEGVNQNANHVFTAPAAVDVSTKCFIKYAQFVKNKRVHAIYTTQVPPVAPITAVTATEDADTVASVQVA
ncbi:capsid protein [Blackfly DNA Virus 16]|uniref:Capsid protein n=1 Tax=Blackfly DNA Virus 16 TaxID=2586179 RepID=A0A4Y5QKV7_9VIRU|nr:capsid protein [Blackfly DNA Virus 16]